MSDEELAAYEASRDFTSDLVQSIQEMKAGLGTVVYSPLIAARNKTGLSKAEFAALLNISVPTLLAWEKGVEKPSDAAGKLISMANTNPQAFLALARSKP